ncbi:MAG TPA: cupin-like domain-containing protein [Polyangiales bacterium]
MRFEVPRITADVDTRTFFEQFYLPRRPVVIQGVAYEWPALHHWTREYLEEKLERGVASATRQLLWWDIDRTLISHDVLEPRLVEDLRQLQAPLERARSRRLWMSAGGERTPWHYDGNSLEIFNAQVVGRKRFTLVSPHTPIDLGAFSLLGRKPEAMPEELLSEAHDYTSFELRAGELLYLPRHWFHFVESLDSFNANVNWVWTDLRSGSLDNPVSRRELELVAGLYPLFALERRLVAFGRALGLPRLRVQHYSPEYTAAYGGARDFEVPRSFLRQRGPLRALRALLRELFLSLRLKLAGRA